MIELARLLARAYLRLLVARAEIARNSSVFLNSEAPISLDVGAQEWPVVVRENARTARNMKANDLEQRIAQIQKMTWTELRALWRETFGEEPRSGNAQWMRKRLVWGIQAAELGGLSEAAQRRIEELTPLALAWLPMGRRSFLEKNAPVSPAERGRLAPGTTITRPYKGKTVVVTVRDDGFEYDGRLYRSLTAVAAAITGSHWSGNHFFGLGRTRKDDAASA